MISFKLRSSGRLAWVAGAVAPALLALALTPTPTLAGGPAFNFVNGLSAGDNFGNGSLGGWGGEACTVGAVPGPTLTTFSGTFPDVCQSFALQMPTAAGAVGGQPAGSITSVDQSTVDTNLGLYFLADRGNNGVLTVNTRATDATFHHFNTGQYKATLCQLKFRGTGAQTFAQNAIAQTWNNGPTGVVVVNSRTVWASDGDSTIKVCSLGGNLLATISTGGKARTGRGCYDPADQLVLFVNDMERNFTTTFGAGTQLTPTLGGTNDHSLSPTNFPFFTIWNAANYTNKLGTGVKKYLNSAYLNPGLSAATRTELAANYPPGAAINVAATNGVGSCIYNTNTKSFWLAVPECYNQTAQLNYLSDFQFKNGGTTVVAHVYTANAGAGGDPNANHGCVVDIDPKTGGLNHVYEVGALSFGGSAIANVPNATYKDACIAPIGIVQGPSPQVLLGCGSTYQTIPAPEGNGAQATYKASANVSACSGTMYPSINKQINATGTNGSLGNTQTPCSNPDYPTAVLDDGSTGHTRGSLYAVLTQVGGADTVAIDNGGGTSTINDLCVGDPTCTDDQTPFGHHYFMASGGFHVNGTVAAMCTVTATAGDTIGTTPQAFSASRASPPVTCFSGGTQVNVCDTAGSNCTEFAIKITTVTGAVPTGTPGSTFLATTYTCGSGTSADSLPGTQPGTFVQQIPGPGILSFIDADGLARYIAANGEGIEVDPTPVPGPNTSPINNMAAMNVSGAMGQAPGFHTQGCSPNTSLIGSHTPTHSVAVDYITNQVFIAIANNAIGQAGLNNMLAATFPGQQTSSSFESLQPVDMQYPASPAGNNGTCTAAVPCPGQQATPAVWTGFTSLCGRGSDSAGVRGSDTNGCVLVLQDGP
jgi:hypothetical protein